MTAIKTIPKTYRYRENFRRWVVDAAFPLALTLTAGIAVLVPTSLPTEARWTLFAFILAAILWSTTSINPTYVALATVMLLVLTGATSQEQLFEALSSDVIWLMIGAFILGGAVKKTGLAARLTQIVVERARTVASLFWLLTSILIPLSFVIPSTSGRAAVTIPVFRSITAEIDDQRITRAIALLMPTIILVSTIGAIVGAGSHLVANDLLYQITQQRISFTQWAIYGLPFAIAASYASCWVIMRLFLNKSRLHRRLPKRELKQQSLSIDEIKTFAIILLMVLLWVSESWHGYEIATISLAGALLLTSPNFGVLSWQEAMKAVSWNLIIFVGAALVLGRSLIDSDAAQWIIGRIFEMSGIAQTKSHLLILLLLALISLTSHLYMTSHTARAAALVPPMLYLASSLQLNPVAILFLSTLGMDYCLTFPVSSKALLIFCEVDSGTYQPSDLLRLSSVLLLVHLGLILLFYFGYWRWIGLAL